jgi:thiamine biosynthesis protein ThiS
MNLMVITVNGEERQAPAGITVRALLEELEMPLDRVAVELNRRIIRKPQWDTTVVPEGAHLEVVHFVGGGCS